MRYQRRRIFFRNLRLVLAVIFTGGFIVVSTAGEIIDEKKYEDIRNRFVKEASTEESEESEVPEIVEETPEEKTEEVKTTPEETKVEETVEETEISKEEVLEEVEIENSTYTISSELLDSGYEFQRIDFDSLMEINKETCGWITIDGTNIDYPIVNALPEEENYYLHYNLERKKSSSGAIYVDHRCNSLNDDMENLNDITLIYGHHMKGGRMFSNLCNYTNADYINDHPYGVIYTPDGYAYKVTFFAGKIHTGKDLRLIYVDKLSEEDYGDYIDYLKYYSTFESDVTPEYGDKIVGLVTCEYTQSDDSRYILFGILEKQYTNELQVGISVSNNGLTLR